jgi:hypothetical protein
MSAMQSKLKEVLERVRVWPPEDQAELVEIAEEIERRHHAIYHATPDELQAIDEADDDAIATQAEVEAAFRSFRRP